MREGLNRPSARAAARLFAERVAGPVRAARRARGGGDAFWRALEDARAALAPLVADRRVALVGNAASLAAAGAPQIDAFDVVVRINRGPFVAARCGTIGTRTDVLLVSGPRMAIAVATDLPRLPAAHRTPAATVFLAGEAERLPTGLTRRMSFYPPALRAALCERQGAPPSSGAMGVDLLSRLTADGELHLFGFDFWRTPTSYDGRRKPGPHAPMLEEAYVRSVIPAARIHPPGRPVPQVK